MTTTRLICTWTMVMLLSSVRLHAAAAAGEVLVYDGVANSAVATNALRVTGTTNVAVKGNLTAHSGTFTNLTASVPVETDASKKLVSGTVTGTGAFVKDTSPTIVTPTIASFANATHNHQNAAGGGSLSAAAIGSGTLATARLDTAVPMVTIGAVFDGEGAVIAAGSKVYVRVPYACTITSATILADQSGSIVVDVWKDTYANYPPTDADSITSSAPPTISSAVKSEDTALTGWTTSVVAGDTLVFNVDSATTITHAVVLLRASK